MRMHGICIYCDDLTTLATFPATLHHSERYPHSIISTYTDILLDGLNFLDISMLCKSTSHPVHMGPEISHHTKPASLSWARQQPQVDC